MRFPHRLQLSLLLSVLAIAWASPQLKFGSTTLSGQPISPAVEFFGGIPFAEPPLGQLRLRPPIFKPRLNVSTFDASDYGTSCPQPRLFGGDIPISEDCLTINVHRPIGTKPSDMLPVFFWTYGGAYVVGGSPEYNGSRIVEHSIQRVSSSSHTPPFTSI
jgi:carboxylesterase type B